jgi:mannose-6-phosphate isomerase class I
VVVDMSSLAGVSDERLLGSQRSLQQFQILTKILELSSFARNIL